MRVVALIGLLVRLKITPLGFPMFAVVWLFSLVGLLGCSKAGNIVEFCLLQRAGYHRDHAKHTK